MLMNTYCIYVCSYKNPWLNEHNQETKQNKTKTKIDGIISIFSRRHHHHHQSMSNDQSTSIDRHRRRRCRLVVVLLFLDTEKKRLLALKQGQVNQMSTYRKKLSIFRMKKK